MASPTTDAEDRTSKFSAVLRGTTKPTTVAKRRRLPRWLFLSVAAMVLLGLGVAGTVQSNLLTPSQTGRSIMTERVRRADMVVSVTEDGSVESAHNVDIKCEVKGGATILWIIKDGTQVKTGEELVKLDSASIEDQISQQTITTRKAEALKIEAEKAWETAKIAVQEFEQGTYLQQLKQLEVTATVAKENLESSKNLLHFYNRMARQGYVTSLQRNSQEFAVERAQLDLDVAQKAIDVLKEFTRRKTLVTLQSTESSTLARMKSEEAAYQLEEDRLDRLQNQLKKCVIEAPDDGMVVYANDQMQSGRGGGGSPQSMVEEGTLMRERQNIIKLPDLSKMQVKSTVHESKIDALQRGMRARIRIQDHDFQGTVTAVANQAEPSSWFMGNVKEYATIVSIDSDPHGYGLRPGMTAAVEILIANLKNVVSVPVQAVVEQGGKFYCWVNTPSGPRKQSVVLGMANNTRIEIKDGLAEGDEVLLNPRTVVDEAREDVKSEETIDVKKRFGDEKPAPLPKAADTASDRSKGGKFDLMALDKDGDKKVSKEEAPEQLQGVFSRIDKNSDGFIDAKEAAEAAARRRQMEQQGGAPGGAGPGGPRGPGGP